MLEIVCPVLQFKSLSQIGPVALTMDSTRRSAGNGLCKNAMQPKALAWLRIVSLSDPLMNIVGKVQSIARSWRTISTPVMSPSSMSTRRHAATDVVAALMNSSAEPYSSV